ncbi:MAG: signal peptidase I [Gammaproteobacteria bacterium]|nr:signal peptidase I [Gammaproteobacteria bacterium]
MSINLALILTILTAVSGVVVLFNRFYYAKKSSDGNVAIDTLIEYSRSFFPVLLFVLIVRSFVFEPFRIPSGSMMPTLIDGDYIFVKKYSYGLRWPVIEKKFYDSGSPERGDVVVFRLPSNPSINYIKRVVGLPGDIIAYDSARLTINGNLMPLSSYPDLQTEVRGYFFNETLDGREHAIRHSVDVLAASSAPPRVRVFEVPAGHYFMMGDNRDNSQDSRFIGPIPETHLVGEAVRIWMHMDGIEWPNWSRIGTKIQ